MATPRTPSALLVWIRTVGPDDVTLAVGLLLVVTAVWWRWGAAFALLVPGVVLVGMALFVFSVRVLVASGLTAMNAAAAGADRKNKV